jgi:hypothetical protein
LIVGKGMRHSEGNTLEISNLLPPPGMELIVIGKQ